VGSRLRSSCSTEVSSANTGSPWSGTVISKVMSGVRIRKLPTTRSVTQAGDVVEPVGLGDGTRDGVLHGQLPLELHVAVRADHRAHATAPLERFSTC
jgi:hypothetical protein